MESGLVGDELVRILKDHLALEIYHNGIRDEIVNGGTCLRARYHCDLKNEDKAEHRCADNTEIAKQNHKDKVGGYHRFHRALTDNRADEVSLSAESDSVGTMYFS